ncbi:hypothetical protein Ancab_012924 [Ancistrocladus abbreviatus]
MEAGFNIPHLCLLNIPQIFKDQIFSYGNSPSNIFISQFFFCTNYTHIDLVHRMCTQLLLSPFLQSCCKACILFFIIFFFFLFFGFGIPKEYKSHVSVSYLGNPLKPKDNLVRMYIAYII